MLRESAQNGVPARTYIINEVFLVQRSTSRRTATGESFVTASRRRGVQFRVFQAPVEVQEGGVVFCDCENVQPEDGGRVVTRILQGTEHFVPCDTLLTAISEKPDFQLFEGTTAALGNGGWPVTSDGGKVEGLPNVWVAGDFRLGPRTVVEAVASARSAVNEILENLEAVLK